MWPAAILYLLFSLCCFPMALVGWSEAFSFQDFFFQDFFADFLDFLDQFSDYSHFKPEDKVRFYPLSCIVLFL